MNKKLLIFNILLIGFCLLPTFASALTISDLITNAKQYDGQTIEIEAEVIGDIMHRRNGVWLNVNDGSAAIGVFTSKEILPEIKFRGNFKTKGDILKVTGKFNRADRSQGGDLDIRAAKIEVVTSGYVIRRPLDRDKMAVLIVLFPVVLLLIIFKPRPK